MDALGVALLVVICTLVGLAIRYLAGDRPIISDVLRYRPPGWPTGVQEDDDLRWRWRARAPSGPRTEPVHAHVTISSRLGQVGRRGR